MPTSWVSLPNEMWYMILSHILDMPTLFNLVTVGPSLESLVKARYRDIF